MAREGERYAEAAAQQFDLAVKAAREEAAGRLSRELDRAVETFVRQSDAVFAERLAQTGRRGPAAARGAPAAGAVGLRAAARRALESFAQRVAEADADLRRTLGAFFAEAEAERSTLEARLAELARRVDRPTATAH